MDDIPSLNHLSISEHYDVPTQKYSSVSKDDTHSNSMVSDFSAQNHPFISKNYGHRNLQSFTVSRLKKRISPINKFEDHVYDNAVQFYASCDISDLYDQIEYSTTHNDPSSDDSFHIYEENNFIDELKSILNDGQWPNEQTKFAKEK